MSDDNKPGAPASPWPSGQLYPPPSEGTSKYTPSPSRALLIVPEHPPATSDAGPSIEQQLAELRAQLQAIDADLAEKNAVIADLRRALVTMDREAKADEQTIAELANQNARLQADVKSMRFQIESELMDQFTELHDRVQAANLRESQLGTRNVDMDTRELAIGNRQKTVDELFKKLAEENLENPDVFNTMLETFKKDLEVEYAQADKSLARKAEVALQQRNAAAKSDEFIISMIDKLKKLNLLDPQGVESHIDHATSAGPRSLADSRHADPASQQSAEEIQAIQAQIFSSGVDVGYLHYAMQLELLRGFRGLIKGSDGTPIQVAPEKVAFLKDYNNPRHPYQTGLRVGRTASWSVLCKAHKRPEWDTRQFKYEWRLEAFSPLDLSPRPKTFWDGVLKSVEDTREAFEKQMAEAENSGSSGAAAVASTSKSGKKKDAEGGGSKNQGTTPLRLVQAPPLVRILERWKEDTMVSRVFY